MMITASVFNMNNLQVPRFGKCLATVAAFALSSLAVSAAFITVTNASFETPVTTNFIALPTAYSIGTWIGYTKFTAVVKGGVLGVQPAGLDGSQFGDLSGEVGGGIFQDCAQYDNSSDTNLYWQAGQTYTLTVGVFGRSDTPPLNGYNINLQLFYRPGNNGPANVLATRQLTWGTDPLSTTAVTDYTVSWTVMPGAPEVGKPICIWFNNAGTGGVGTDWGLDNVRLNWASTPPLLWSGSANGDWDINHTTNWINYFSSSPDVWNNGNVTVFDNSASGTTTVNLTTLVSPLSLMVSNSSKAYTFTGSGSITGVQLIKKGAGSLTLQATNTFSNGTSEIQNGTLVLAAPTVFNSQLSVGNTTNSGASLMVSNTSLSVSSYLAISPGGGAGGNTSTVIFSNASVICGNLSVGWDGGVAGNKTKQSLGIYGNSTLVDNGICLLGESVGSTSTVVVANNTVVTKTNSYLSIGASGTAYMTVKDSATFNTRGDFNVADIGNATGMLTLQDNAQITASSVYVGKSAACVGTVNQTGGSFTGNLDGSAEFQIGVNGQGYWNQSGGSNNAAGYVSIGRFASASGALNVSGGSFNQTGTGTGLIVGEGGYGVLTIANSGLVTSVSTSFGVTLGLASSGSGEIDLNGGTLVAHHVRGGSGFSVFFFNGGTLKAGQGAGTNFMSLLTSIIVSPGGAVIDSAGNNITIANDIYDDGGGLTKLGAGALYLNGANTYSGLTVVSNGVLGGTGTIAGSVNVGPAGTLAPGVTVGTLQIKGNLTLSGNLAIEVKKSFAQSNDLTVVTGALTNAGMGSVIVTNLSANALVVGDKFTLFSKPMLNGGALTIAGAGVIWTNNLAVDGSISVLSTTIVSTSPVALSNLFSAGNLNLSWPADHTGWRLEVQTNSLMAGIGTNWVTWLNSAATNTVFIPVNPMNPTVFFRLVYP